MERLRFALLLLCFASPLVAQSNPCQEKRDFESRAEYYGEQLAREPDDVTALINRANAYWNIGNLPAAISDASRAIEIDPRSELAYTTRGRLYAHQANYVAAIADFTHAIELNPKFARSFYGRGRSYQFSGKQDLAIRDFEAMLSIEPVSSAAYGGLGISLRNSGRTSEANVALARSVELISKKIDEARVGTCVYQQLFDRGIVLLFSGRYNDAMADFDRAINLSPKSFEPYYYRGLLYRDIKALDQARDSFSKAIELNEFFAEAYRQRSDVNYALKNKEEGDRDLSRYKELSGKEMSASPKSSNPKQ